MDHVCFTGGADSAAAAAGPGPSSSAQAAAVSQTGATSFAACCSRARVSYNDADPTYVFKALRSPDCSVVAASLSNNAIKLYSSAQAQLVHAGDIPGAHQDTISDIQFALPDVPHALYSCSRDGHVKAWDLRSKQLAERLVGLYRGLWGARIKVHVAAETASHMHPARVGGIPMSLAPAGACFNARTLFPA